MVRILEVVHQFPPSKVGGTEIYTQNLSRELAKRGHEVVVFHREERAVEQPYEEEYISQGLKIRRVCYNLNGASSLEAFFSSFSNRFIEESFVQLLEDMQPDIVHFQHLKDLSVSLVTLAHRRGLPAVLTLHDYWLFCGNAQLITPRQKICSGPFFWLNCAYCAASRVKAPHLRLAAPFVAALFAYRSLRVNRAMSKIALFLTPTLFTREIFVRHGTPEAKIRHLGPGIEIEVIERVPLEKRGQILHFVYIGGLAWQKGVHVLVEAFNDLDSKKAALSIYGDESAFPDYSARLHKLARNPAIRFLGRLPHHQLGQVLARADVVVVPSVWYETYCLVVQEAFAAKVPVIASNLGALAQSVRNGVDGLLVLPGDPRALREAMERVMETSSLLESWRDNIVPVKALKEHADEILTIYEELLAQGRREWPVEDPP